MRDRDRTLRVRPDRQAGNAQDGGLLLDPAGVRDDHRRTADEREEVDVAQRVDDPQALARPQAGGLEDGPAAGMERQHDGHRAARRRRASRRRVPRPRGRRRWPAGASWPPRTARRGPGGRAIAAASNRSRFASSVSIIGLPTRWTRSGRDAHRARGCRRPRGWSRTAGPTSRSVTRRLISSGIVSSKLRRPASTWAIGSPVFDATSAAATVELTSPYTIASAGSSAAKAPSRATMIAAVWTACDARPDAEVEVRLRQAEVAEEDVGHRGVVVLAGVDDPLLDPTARAGRAITGAAFMKLGRAPTTCTTTRSVTGSAR